ncbi:hypothetical protein [uncultured Chitinibacter sp.]|nr:hypothetical protein [uncultured Chitinibacter sp.]
MAVTHADPAQYYEALSCTGLHFDSTLDCWVAPSAKTVQQVLSDSSLLVRPENEPVPKKLIGTSAGVIFSKLLRMNDGAIHAALKSRISAAIQQLSLAEIQQQATQIAAQYSWCAPIDAEAVNAFCYAIPTMVIASLLGFEPDEWAELCQEVNDVVRCFAPGGTDAELGRGIIATSLLEQRFYRQLTKPGPLLLSLQCEILQCGFDDPPSWVVANAIGLLFQANESCAGLISQALIHTNLSEKRKNARELIKEVMQNSPPIQNTRRFVANDLGLRGCPMHAGQTVLAILRTPDGITQANNAFGYGPHQCPGETWAYAIAEAAIEQLLQLKLDPTMWNSHRWRRSLNARVPEFINKEAL